MAVVRRIRQPFEVARRRARIVAPLSGAWTGSAARPRVLLPYLTSSRPVVWASSRCATRCVDSCRASDAHVLASVAADENEVRRERILAGQAAARRQGKRWGRSAKGRRLKVKDEQARVIRHLHRHGTPIAAIARAVTLSRPTIYSVLDASKGLPAGA